MFPLFPSAVQDSLTPASTSRAPSVNAVNAAILLLAPLASPTFTGVPAAPTAAPGTNTTQIATTAYVTAAVAAGGGGGGGTSDHGLLVGLGDDDHTQYHNDTRGDARYDVRYTAIGHTGAGGTAHANVVAAGAAGFMTGADKTKLDGIATGATLNSPDSTLLNRANHTGSQLASTISDFSESVDDRVATVLVAGANMTVTYNDSLNTITLSAAGAGGGATLADGNYGDITAGSTGTTLTVNAGAITVSKLANMATDSLLGRDTAGTGAPEVVGVTGGLEFSGAGALQTAAFTGDVTKPGGSAVTTVAANAVTLAKMAQVATATILGRATALTGNVEALTGAQATTLLDTFTTTLKGVVPASGGGTANFMRADGTWAAPVATVTDGDKGDVTTSVGGTVWTVDAGAISLAKLANLAQDQFIGRTTASTGVPETATITAAARTVLDDPSVSAMVNTLGGATATGSGGLVRLDTPTLSTPNIGAATGTSLSLGGGTALTTTSRTGTGNLVLANAPTIGSPTFTGPWVTDGAQTVSASAMGASTVVDVTKGKNTKSLSADTSFSFSATPPSDRMFGMWVTNTDTNPHLLTIPSSRSMARSATVTSLAIAASSQMWLNWLYDGTTYHLMSNDGYLDKFDATAGPTVNDDNTKGYGPGSQWLDATANATYICETAGTGAAVWNAQGGGSGVADGDKGDVTVSASGATWTIDNGAVTLAKMANVATDTLIGRDTAATGVPEAITVSGGLEFSGTGSLRTGAFTGDVTKAAGGTALTIAAAAVSLAKMADLAAARFIGRISGTTGVPEAMTGTQATTLLDTFTSLLKGVVPASGGGTTTFLRADGSWASPVGAGTVTNTGNLTANSLVLGNGVTDTKVVAGIVSDGVSKVTLGVAGTNVGAVGFNNATSGQITLQPPTGALGTITLTMPATTDTLVARTTTDTLTNKTLTAPTINGGTATALTGLAVRNGGTGAFDMTVAHNGTLTAGRALTWDLNDAARTISMAGNVSLAGALTTAAAFITAGANSLTLTTTGTTNVTLPTSGTLATQTEAKTECIPIAVGDETTALTTGTAKVTFRMPFAMTVTAVRASVTTAPTGATLIVDINDGGTTIMTTNKLSIDVSEKTSTTAATAAGITDTALADDAEITIDVDQVGSTVAGAGLKVYLIGTRA